MMNMLAITKMITTAIAAVKGVWETEVGVSVGLVD
jgi:hypothetical protein